MLTHRVQNIEQSKNKQNRERSAATSQISLYRRRMLTSKG